MLDNDFHAYFSTSEHYLANTQDILPMPPVFTNDPLAPRPSLTKGFNETEIIIGKTMQYLGIPSVVGHERFFLSHLEQDFQALGKQTHRHEGLLEIHGNNPQSGGIICAHVDRHGLISIGGGEYAYAAQYIREIKYGEQNRSSIAQLNDIAGRFENELVYAYNPETGEKLGRGIIHSIRKGMVNGDSLFSVQGLSNLPMDIPLAYARTARFEKGELRGQIDNALSLGVVYALFRAGFEGTALLTTEEEIGKSWIHMSDWLEAGNIQTKSLLVLDTSPYEIESPIDKGTIIFRNRDKSEVFHEPLVTALKKRCAEMELPYEVKDEVLLKRGKEITQLGSTELGRLIQGSQGRWSGATVQIPTTMYHTSNETTSRKAIRHYYRFLKDILIKNPMML